MMRIIVCWRLSWDLYLRKIIEKNHRIFDVPLEIVAVWVAVKWRIPMAGLGFRISGSRVRDSAWRS